MKASERRNTIIEALIERNSDKIENLACEFSVNEKTIRRDIDELSLYYPIYTECGRYTGGVYIDPSYRMRRKFLKPEEEELLKRLAVDLNGKDLEVMQGLLRQFARGN